MTPTAAVGLLSTILWKPQFFWRIDEIWVLNPPRYVALMRNEVKSVASTRGAIDATADRTQRHTLCLSNPKYVVHATPIVRPDANAAAAKYRDQFRRRVARGAHFSVPYLGLQEFHADVREFDAVRDVPDPQVTIPIGSMPLHLHHQADGTIRPEFFAAMVAAGVMDIPHRGGSK